MVVAGEVVYLVCRGRSGKVRLRGRVVDLEGEEVIVGFEKDPGISLPHSAGCPTEAGELGKFSFVKVPAEAVSTVLPAGWGTRVGGSAPSFEDALAAWEIVSKTVEKLESSEAEAQVQRASPSQPAQESGQGRGANKRMEAELLEMSKSLFGAESEDTEDSEDAEDVAPTRKSKSGHLAPGANGLARSSSAKEGKSKSKTQEDLLQQMVVQQMAQGKSSNDLMPLMMMMFMQQQQQQMKSRDKGRKSRKSRGWDALGSSSSESSSEEDVGKDAGMKAVVSLRKLNNRIKRRPLRIVQEFERDLLRELGVVEGQAWSVKDWLKKQQWGKFKGLFRACIQDAAAYEYIRSGCPEAAAAQLCQNMKSKLQCVLAGGDWSSAWLLCALEDPLNRKEWAGSKEEMAIIAGYTNSLHKLRKKVRESTAAAAEELEEAK